MNWRARKLLLRWMQRNGFSQKAVAALVEAEAKKEKPDAKVSQGTVSRWLKKGVCPRAKMRAIVAKITKGEVPAVAWFEEDDDVPAARGEAA